MAYSQISESVSPLNRWIFVLSENTADLCNVKRNKQKSQFLERSQICTKKTKERKNDIHAIYILYCVARSQVILIFFLHLFFTYLNFLKLSCTIIIRKT